MMAIIRMMKGNERSTLMTKSSTRYRGPHGRKPFGDVMTSTNASKNPMATEKMKPNSTISSVCQMPGTMIRLMITSQLKPMAIAYLSPPSRRSHVADGSLAKKPSSASRRSSGTATT